MILNGFKVGESEKAVAFVRESDVRPGVKPLWLPKSKIVSECESDAMSRKVETDKGDKVGIPMEYDVDESFLAKVGLA